MLDYLIIKDCGDWGYRSPYLSHICTSFTTIVQSERSTIWAKSPLCGLITPHNILILKLRNLNADKVMRLLHIMKQLLCCFCHFDKTSDEFKYNMCV